MKPLMFALVFIIIATIILLALGLMLGWSTLVIQ